MVVVVVGAAVVVGGAAVVVEPEPVVVVLHVNWTTDVPPPTYTVMLVALGAFSPVLE